ncbi:MAG: putative zinc-binding protein [Armatimonadota bacterium]|nr:putative zinc-binding protein [Armatimonadota bacterium]
MADKVCLQPCLGLRKEAVLGRQALYVVHEDMLPDETVLGCGPALNANVQEDVDFINLYPVLAVEACELDCATKLVAKKQKKAARTIRITDLAKGLNLDLEALPEEHIEAEDPAVQAVAKRIAEHVRELLASSK